MSTDIKEKTPVRKIMILNGAGKKDGKTAEMISAFSRAAEANGNEIKEFQLIDMNIRDCLDCQGCSKKEPGSRNPCIQEDDMTKIYEAFFEADVIVFASPVYFWTLSGILKTAVDRLYAVFRNNYEVRPKECVLLMSSGGSDLKLTSEWYHGFEYWMDWKSIGEAINDVSLAAQIGSMIR